MDADYRAYRAELHRTRTPRSLRVGCTLVIVINTAFLALDRWVYPEPFDRILIGRIVLDLFMVVVVALAHRWPALLQTLGCYATGVLTLFAIYESGGATSHYYAGLIILFVGIPALLTFNGLQAMLVIGSLIAGFILPNLVHNGFSQSKVLVVHTFILTASGANSALCSWLIDRTRFSDYGRRRDLEQMLQHVQTFARAVSHDLRNPVTAASEALRLAQSQASERRNDLVMLASKNLFHADRMISGLRDLMKAVGGQRRKIDRLNPAEIVEDVVGEVCSNSDSPPEVTLMGSWIPVAAPREELRHIFRNLIGNVLAHNRGHPCLRIQVSQVVDPDYVRFVVRDNGRGVPEELRQRIFEPFYRASDSHEEGLGMGLAIVQGFVAQWGGRIWVESPKDSGAAFSFTIPRRRPLS